MELANTESVWQPKLEGRLLKLRPLTEQDFEPLFAVASDPLIWEVHPERDRYRREKFEVFFRSGMVSRGALAIHDRASGALIGSSRFTDPNAANSSVEVGYTFLARPYWGGFHNRELKFLMLRHAFQYVETVYFVAGRENFRSRRALAKIGAQEVEDTSAAPVVRDFQKSVLYQIQRPEFERGPLAGVAISN